MKTGDLQLYHREYYRTNRETINERRRGYRKANPGQPPRQRCKRDPAKRRAEKLKNHYGLTPQDFEDMLAKQNGCCALCKSSSPRRRGSSVLAVDHSHKTGEVRGLLCHRCNLGLGAFEDNFEVLLAAARYIQAAHDIL